MLWIRQSSAQQISWLERTPPWCSQLSKKHVTSLFQGLSSLTRRGQESPWEQGWTNLPIDALQKQNMFGMRAHFKHVKTMSKSTCNEGFEARFSCLQWPFVGNWVVLILWSKLQELTHLYKCGTFSGVHAPWTLLLAWSFCPDVIPRCPPVKNLIEIPIHLQ